MILHIHRDRCVWELFGKWWQGRWRTLKEAFRTVKLVRSPSVSTSQMLLHQMHPTNVTFRTLHTFLTKSYRSRRCNINNSVERSVLIWCNLRSVEANGERWLVFEKKSIMTIRSGKRRWYETSLMFRPKSGCLFHLRLLRETDVCFRPAPSERLIFYTKARVHQSSSCWSTRLANSFICLPTPSTYVSRSHLSENKSQILPPPPHGLADTAFRRMTHRWRHRFNSSGHDGDHSGRSCPFLFHFIPSIPQSGSVDPNPFRSPHAA